MAAGRYNFTIEQGSEFRQVMTWKADGDPVDLTGYTARMKLKEAGIEVLSLTTTPTVDGDVITLGGEEGTITIVISDETTTDLDFTEARYDLEMVPPTGDPRRLLQGVFDFSREVTD